MWLKERRMLEFVLQKRMGYKIFRLVENVSVMRQYEKMMIIQPVPTCVGRWTSGPATFALEWV